MPVPQSHPRAAWSSNDDQTIFNLIVIAIGVGLGSYLLWTYYHGQISAGVIWLRHQEMVLLGNITDKFDRADAQMLRTNPYRVSLRDLYGISHAIGQFWRIPACMFIVLLAALCMVRAAPSRFKRAFDLDGLAREMLPNFKASAAFIGRNLGLTAPAQGAPRSADYALTADEWIERFGSDPKGAFDESGARLSLTAQLGRRWTGPENAAPVVKLLFVAFALHVAERRGDAIELLGAASEALACADERREGPAEPLSPSGEIIDYVTSCLKDPEAFREARDLTIRHAYTAPAMMSLLNAARLRHGVLAPAQFAWLKLIDRPLWYALHSLGFETEGVGRYLHPNPRVEALGARDHWAVECAAGAPVFKPDLERALQTLRRHARARAVTSPLLRAVRKSATVPAS
jgi:intracellular multiplication protein IcmP